MSLQKVVDELVEERSLDALERLTGSNNEDVFDALVFAAGRILSADHADPADDEIVEELRHRLIEVKATAALIDALSVPEPVTQEFALACLSEIGDMVGFEPMLRLLEEGAPEIRPVAAEQLSLLTHYDFGADPVKWREWQNRRVKGLVEQEIENREDQARLLNARMKGTIDVPPELQSESSF